MLHNCQNTHIVSAFVIIKYNHSAIIEKKCTSIAIIELNEVYINVKIVMDDASTKTGLGEGALTDLKVGDVVQFERVGFARLDEIKDDELIFYYAHK